MTAKLPTEAILNAICPGGVPEYRFHETRRWRFDYAWPHRMVAFEIEGGTWKGGRHSTGAGYRADCIKYNTAAINGWTVIRATTDMVRDGTAFEHLTSAIARADRLTDYPSNNRDELPDE